jgi:UDP-glucose 4-epimerase
MKVLIAGTSSYLAPAVLPLLTGDERIGQIIAVDSQGNAADDGRTTQILTDLQSSQVRRIMTGVDAVVLLPLTAGRHQEGGPGVTLEGARNVVRATLEQGVRCLVHVSSAWVYSLPMRERPVTEEHARAALPGWREIETAVALEESLDHLIAEHPTTRVVRLRPHLTIGRHGWPPARAMLRSPIAIRFKPPIPRLQCVHASDVAQAIQQALFRDVEGAFNLATEDALTLHEMQWRVNRGWFGLPSGLVRSQRRLASRFGGGPDPRWIDAVRHGLVLDSSRARRRLGWKPAYDTAKACLKAFND